MNRPDWLSPSMYPFESRWYETDEGTMHYVDEGAGEPIVMVHGTPTWSFLYRHVIADLSTSYRTIALDHLGFGLSDKPRDGAYRPVDHARRFAAFVDHLGLERFTLVVHDFGGPIALPYAIQHPESVARLVLCNTWLWSLEGDRRIRMIDRLVQGFLGRLFYLRWNGSPRVILKAAWGDRRPLTEEIHRHYLAPYSSRDARMAPWVLARELIGSSEWYESWWAQRARLQETPTHLVWGLADPTFGEADLERWERAFERASVRRLPAVGHFVPDEAHRRFTDEVRGFLGKD